MSQARNYKSFNELRPSKKKVLQSPKRVCVSLSKICIIIHLLSYCYIDDQFIWGLLARVWNSWSEAYGQYSGPQIMLAWRQITVLAWIAQAIPQGAHGLWGDIWYTGGHRRNVHIRWLISGHVTHLMCSVICVTRGLSCHWMCEVDRWIHSFETTRVDPS